MSTSSQHGLHPKPLTRKTFLIKNVRLPVTPDDGSDSTINQLYNVTCGDGRVDAVEPTDKAGAVCGNDEELSERFDVIMDARGVGILLPGLCHAPIHLDKCFLLDRCDELRTGDFAEALKVTAKAKAAFPSDLTDLYNRGKRLVIDSVQCGVTAMRAHVEVDKTVRMNCLDIGLKLKDEFQTVCDMQICAFAQDPLFDAASNGRPGGNYTLLQEAAKRKGVQAVGSAPYVEPSLEQAKRNMTLILDTAYESSLHADFHLDYNLDPTAEPLIWYLLEQLQERIKSGRWADGARVCVGHATRLSLFSKEEWTRFRTTVEENKLPVTLVGLPPSDMYMMGRGQPGSPRATLNVSRLEREHGVKVAMAVNNVENAFTPQGTTDPLALCPMGVAVFQDGTKKGCRTLIEAVTITARKAIAAPSRQSLTPVKGDAADFVLLHENDSLYSAALSPCYTRTVIKNGEVVATRRADKWIRLVAQQ
ncbi:Metallo-dependent hydrolase [Rhodofomes roseus]|uniref:Metallo-dependent hydrolase n=1 Tax=Rhodofomes roseus TaxID=34475 RepID=A0ABQ8KS00_9APHY|nr:Metallo-dependent hydrolase [Rhodofomes roseus]KAH9841570.1 Metallo-dependent hydrolase [Rhodofomes roseus]